MTVSEDFETRWRSAKHVGAARPTQHVYVRDGYMHRGYDTWSGPEVRDIQIPGEKAHRPWQGTWRARSDWFELPNVTSVQIDQDFTDNGLMGLTVKMGNVLLRPESAMGYAYHLYERGALSPFRGYQSPTRPAARQLKPNEWTGRLIKSAQILVMQGYGDALEKTFTGIVEEVDPATKPDTITLTVRDFGLFLTDETMFGHNISPHLTDPVVFAPIKLDKNKNKAGGVGVGHGAKASSSREGQHPRFVTDKKNETVWISRDRSAEDLTEWVEVKVPKGRYEEIAVHPRYAGMTMFLGIKVSDTHMGQEPPELDDESIATDWIYPVQEDSVGGIVPGDTNGGWPYVKKWEKVPAKGQRLDIGVKLECGSDTIFRIGFRKLAHIREDQYRAGVRRFAPVKQKGKKVVTTYVGHDALASSHRDGHAAALVLDKPIKTKWVSQDRSGPNLTEFVEIHLPQGRYRAFRIFVPNPGTDMYVGIFAKPRQRTSRKTGDEIELPAKRNGVAIDNGWVTDPFGGTTPGATNGGWPYVRAFPDVEVPDHHKTERYFFTDTHDIFELGKDSVLRIGFRSLHQADGDGYRAAVSKLHATRRGPLIKPTKDEKGDHQKKIRVSDASDIVRVVLRWAGFKEYEVEDTGADLKGEWTFDYTTSYMDVINKVAETTGFCFFMREPGPADLSIGVPVFKYPNAYRDDLPDVKIVRDSHLLTSMQVKITQEHLSRIIRVRGHKNAKHGRILESDQVLRWMAVYRPPWVKPGARLAGKLNHFIHTEPRLKDQQSVEVFARLVALNQALQSVTAIAEIPGTPQFQLDDQLGVVDDSTGFNTRLYVANRSSTFERGKWISTIGGSLLDTPDVVGVKASLIGLLPEGGRIGSGLSDLMLVDA